MKSSQRVTLRFGAILLGGTALASCGGDSNSATPPVAISPPVTVTTAQEAKFGTAFAADFRATANSDPAAVADGDIVPVDPTTEPIPIV